MASPGGTSREWTTATPSGARQTFRVRVTTQRDGQVVVTCESPVCMSRASSEADALDKIKQEIRYRIEWCPCTGVDDEYVQLAVERG